MEIIEYIRECEELEESKALLFKKAWLLYEQKEKILKDKRMMLAMVPAITSWVKHPATLADYLRFWSQCEGCKVVSENGTGLICSLMFNPMTGSSVATVSFLDGRVEQVKVGDYKKIMSSFGKAAKESSEENICAFTLKEVVEMLKVASSKEEVLGSKCDSLKKENEELHFRLAESRIRASKLSSELQIAQTLLNKEECRKIYEEYLAEVKDAEASVEECRKKRKELKATLKCGQQPDADYEKEMKKITMEKHKRQRTLKQLSVKCNEKLKKLHRLITLASVKECLGISNF